MSWLFKESPPQSPTSYSSAERLRQAGGVGVKDLPATVGTIGRQRSKEAEEEVEPSPKGFVGIRNDLAELGGSLKSGLSKLRSSLLPFRNSSIEEEEEDEEEEEEEEEEDYVAGITEEVIGFVEEVATRPECWTDFPLPLKDDFRMSDAQRKHALAIAETVPSLAALKASLHNYIGGNRFWLIYFILLLPRLSEQDREILSNSQIVETRSLLLKKIKDLRNENVSKSEDPRTSTKCEADGKSGATKESPSRRSEVTEIVDATKRSSVQDQETWQEDSDFDISTSANNRKRLEHEDALSFSEIEDDDSDRSSRTSASRQPQMHRTPSASSWVQLQESSTNLAGTHRARQSFSRDKDSDVESTDWHKVDEFD